MPQHLEQVCAGIEHELRTRPQYAHTSHFLVVVDRRVVHDVHLHGPDVADVFSVTKSVLATLVGTALRDGLVPGLDLRVDEVLDLGATPSAGQTIRHLLTMTRGSEVDGAWEIDEVNALAGGWVAHIAHAPRIAEPGAEFRYDNGAAHLLGAVLARLLGRSLSDYAAARLFGPLGVRDWHWPRDPDGLEHGAGHLRLRARDLAALGTLWMQDGRWQGEQLVDPAFAQAMVRPQSAGGPPEGRPYGYGIWIDPWGPFAGGWAGQHVTTVPAASAVVVTTGDPRFDFGPPPTDELSPGWRPARDLVVERLVPALLCRP